MARPQPPSQSRGRLTTIKPVVFDPANRHQLDQWVKAASLPFDAGDYLVTVEQSVRDALRYSVVNIKDAATTLGGVPFENRARWYGGSENDLLLNILVPRFAAAPVALANPSDSDAVVAA